LWRWITFAWHAGGIGSDIYGGDLFPSAVDAIAGHAAIAVIRSKDEFRGIALGMSNNDGWGGTVRIGEVACKRKSVGKAPELSIHGPSETTVNTQFGINIAIRIPFAARGFYPAHFDSSSVLREERGSPCAIGGCI
jgi:hypothetical protein